MRKRNNLWLVLLFLQLTVYGQNTNPNDNPDILLQKLVTEHGIVGMSAGYSIDGKIVWKNSEGYANLDLKKRFSDTTKTRIASISKSMTAIAILQLYEKGLIDLDVSINTYLPEFPKKAKGDITIRQLLSHTSGLSGYQSSKETESQINYPTLKEALEVFKNRDLLFKPGTEFYYTTYGYVVLGRIIEVVSETSFETYMQHYIWDQAEMANTGIEKFDTHYSNKSELYHKKRKQGKIAEKNNLSNRTPGGGFYSTLNDMIRFGNAIVDNKLIKQSSLELMTSNQFEQKEGNPYGFGWFLYGPPPNENLVIGHSGEQTGAATQLMIIPKSKTVVVVLSNTSGTWKDIVTYASELIRISEIKK